MGLDRMLMLLKGIPDIRILRSTEASVAAQMTDLTPYRAVSAMPAIRRDLSVAVDRDDLAEDLGDRVRDALGPDADCVETVEILSQTPCAELPPRALERLGARPDQKNVLLKVAAARPRAGRSLRRGGHHPGDAAHPRSRSGPRRPGRPDRHPHARRHRPRQPPADHRRTCPPA
ncbi:putative phenylalanyl-tRNA synthetase subunit alpha [Streptomyces sparsogenes DSM 40356]|uniref:Putative phenylalanyl-tRNA synthetase subunit alpha n=2 Tax=Streptomyces sparsogenes TaxID=67365 RepID=A0A1R1SAZ2_9ACTN|nr:putative phenylalanyl-tRNA synthetase subunit alpha [Streptomyces sparsogenes DSM 40356]